MLNAKKFREITDVFWENNADKIQPILDELMKAAQNGCYSVTLSKGTQLNDRQKDRLRRMEFEVEESPEFDGSGTVYKISFLRDL